MLYSIAASRRSLLVTLTIFICAAQLVATGSRTALVSGGLGLIVLDGLRRKWIRVATALAVGVALWTLIPAFGQRTSAVGADAGLSPMNLGSGLNFSGRLVLWSDAWVALMGDDQLTGRGIGATDLFFSTRYAELRSVHSGYLLLLVDVGLIGLVLCVLFYLQRLARLVHYIVGSVDVPRHVPMAAALIVAFLIASLMESTFAGYALPTLGLWISLAWAEWSLRGSGERSIRAPGP